MSRIGKQPIIVPTGVEVNLQGQKITLKGPKGTLERSLHPKVKVAFVDQQLVVTRSSDERNEVSLHGLTRALLNNMVVGVSKGFEKKLEIIGVGYRAQVSGKKVILSLGFSHPIEYSFPKDIAIEIDKENKNILVIQGPDKEAVGEIAANIRGFRPPEPYKGKGISYLGEHIVRKAGKAAAGAGSKE